MIIAFKRFLPTVVIYVPVHLALGLPVGPEQLWVLPLLGLLVVLATGLAMIVAALQVYFRDLKNFMPYLLRVWLYGSPVLYYADEMPEQYRFLLDVNPLGQLLAAWSGVINQAQAPTSHQLLVAARGRSASSSSVSSTSSRGSVISLSGSTAPSIVVQDVSVTYKTTFERSPTLRGMISAWAAARRSCARSRRSRTCPSTCPRHRARDRRRERRRQVDAGARDRGDPAADRGRIDVFGRVSTLLALGVGFNRNLTGRDNVRLGGLAAGLQREKLDEKYDEIVNFAELGEFMDMPMRTYSSGMYGRLAFSVAVNMDPDILLIDEAMSVGDARFRRKSANDRELCSQAHTIVLVSHALGTVRELCDQAIWRTTACCGCGRARGRRRCLHGVPRGRPGRRHAEGRLNLKRGWHRLGWRAT